MDAAASNEANATSAIVMVLIVALLAVLVLGFFGYTCTSGTFDIAKFDAANCFVLDELLESNVVTTETLPTMVPEPPCGQYTMFNCPSVRCQVDDVQGVCEDAGQPFEEVDCHLANYQSEDTCPLVGCEWGGGQCAQPGKLCGYERDIQTCVNRDDCNWDFFRPAYGVCIPKSTPTTDGQCSDLGSGRQADCDAAPGCAWSSETGTCTQT